MFARPLLFVVFSEDGVRWGFLLAGLLLSQVVVIVAVVVISVFDEDGMCMSCWAWDRSNWDGSKVVRGHREVCSCAVGGTLEDGLGDAPEVRDREALPPVGVEGADLALATAKALHARSMSSCPPSLR